MLNLLLSPLLLLAAPQEQATVIWNSYGSEAGAAYGERIRLTDDLNGDDIADLLAWSPTASTDFLSNNGAVRAISLSDGSLLWEFKGWRDDQMMGEDIPFLGDIDQDGIQDILLTFPFESTQGLIQNGSALALSGQDGTVLWRADGSADFENLGSEPLILEDLNADGVLEIAMGHSDASGNGLSLNGRVQVLSGANGQALWATFGSESGEFLGEVLALPGDLNGDGIPDLMAGSPTASTSGHFRNGVVKALSGIDGSVLWSYYGTADFVSWGRKIIPARDVDGDGINEVVYSSPTAPAQGFWQSGILAVFSGATGQLLWQLEGSSDLMRLGQTATVVGDVDLDGALDFCLGIPHATVNGKLDAGQIRCVSGLTGATLWELDGEVLYGLLGENLEGLADLDGDMVYEVFTASADADANGMADSGFAMLVNGADGSIKWHLTGSTNGEHLGEHTFTNQDFSGDGIDDIVVGSPRAEHNGVFNAGKIFCIDSSTGNNLWVVGGTEKEQSVGYRMNVLTDCDDDGTIDLVATFHMANLNGLVSNGYMMCYSGATGAPLWQVNGTTDGEHLGNQFLLVEDRDYDDHFDFVSSSHFADHPTRPDSGLIRMYSAGWNKHLEIHNAIAGSTAEFTVRRAGSQNVIHLVSSLYGPGPTALSNYPGLTLSLTLPLHVVGQVTTNTAGDASLQATVPLSLRGRYVWLQGVSQTTTGFSLTNLASALIQ